jgi:hypothetical protein
MNKRYIKTKQKYLSQKWAGVAHGVGPEFKPQYHERRGPGVYAQGTGFNPQHHKNLKKRKRNTNFL